MTKIYFILLTCLVLVSCGSCNRRNMADDGRKMQKYEPEEGKCFLFIGQDLGAVGGMEQYNDGYCDHFAVPAGITVYLGLGDNGRVSGLYEIDNWGAGDCCADLYARTEKFDRCMIAVGLPLVNQEERIVRGEYDAGLDKIGAWIGRLAPRPVFLRIGYEFDGKDWNGYVPETYIPAFRYIKDRYDAAGIDNIAYVWQSKGTGSTADELREFYPGDDYVDWCAYSYFDGPDLTMIEFARMKGKPVFLVEATPTFQNGQGVYSDGDIKKAPVARKIWDVWMTGMFDVIERNADVVKAVSYINADWYAQPLWIGNPTFEQCDSRIQMSDYVRERWEKKISSPRYIRADGLNWSELPR